MSAETIPAVFAAISAGISLLAAGGVWGALFVNRRNVTDTIEAQVNIAARNSRAAVVSANRQKWIDAIRDDVAEFISLGTLESLRDTAKHIPEALVASHADQIATMAARERLLARIEMRLKWRGPKAEEDHTALVTALHKLLSRPGTEEAVKDAASKIFKAEWERLKKEASGIDPFVREAVPKRRQPRVRHR